MAEVGFKTELRWKLRESVIWIHFNPPILSALLVGRLEGAVVGRTVEGYQLVEAVAEALKGAVSTINDAIGETCLAAGLAAAEEDLLRYFDCSVEDIAEGTTELTRGVILRSRRGLNVGVGGAGQGEGEGDQDEFSHYVGHSEGGMRAVASGYCRFMANSGSLLGPFRKGLRVDPGFRCGGFAHAGGNGLTISLRSFRSDFPRQIRPIGILGEKQTEEGLQVGIE